MESALAVAVGRIKIQHIMIVQILESVESVAAFHRVMVEVIHRLTKVSRKVSGRGGKMRQENREAQASWARQ